MISYLELLELVKKGEEPKKVLFQATKTKSAIYIAEHDIDKSFTCYVLENKDEENDEARYYLGESILESTMVTDKNIKIIDDELTIEDKLNKIFAHFGIERQSLKAIEEVSELVNAITKYETLKINEYQIPMELLVREKDHIIEEFADCMVVLSQIGQYYRIPPRTIEEVAEEKIDRTLKRIDENYY